MAQSLAKDRHGATVAWYDSQTFDAHGVGGHPERPERLHAIRQRIEDSGLSRRLVRREAPACDPQWLKRVHSEAYIERIRQLGALGTSALDADTYMVEGTERAAYHAAGAVADAVHNVMQGTFDRAFCSVRPPGHHARPSTGMGFCIFNSVAIGAEVALCHEGIERVAIFDWDVHHGNGTEEAFYERADVFYASVHQAPAYPGTGRGSDRGRGPGLGANLNVPLAPGAGDEELLRAWTAQIEPALSHYRPQVLLLSVGFDADSRDPLAQLEITTAGYRALSQGVIAWADRHCVGGTGALGRVISVLEGGYDLEALADDVQAHLETLV